MDESGHDHKQTPYEMRGGVALHASRVWSFAVGVRALELRTIGAHLHDYGSELKGEKLLSKDRFKLGLSVAHGPGMEKETTPPTVVMWPSLHHQYTTHGRTIRCALGDFAIYETTL